MFFRGVWLAALGLALRASAKNILGAPINMAGVTVVFVYALMHGFNYIDGSLIFSPKGIALVGVYGVFYLWLRERTASLVMPIVAHSLCNMTAIFV